ncbi:MAG: type IV pilus biogenesis/stability protein PilW, partial [Gammaproteobacteria bacterium HGW-Gammaproteobacteria-7]
EQNQEEAVRLNLGLAQGYMQRGDYEVALERLLKAEKLDPKSADVQTMLGFLNERIGRAELAKKHYSKSVELNPDSGAILNNYAAWMCRDGRAGEADAWFRRALKDPFYKTPEAALSNAGKCALDADDSARAEQYFRQLLEINPASAPALEHLARLSLEQGKLMSARAFWQRREAMPVEDPLLLDLAARIEQALGNAEGARRYQQRLSSDFPDFRPPTPTTQPRP